MSESEDIKIDLLEENRLLKEKLAGPVRRFAFPG